MAVVYKARDERFGSAQPVAVKFVRADRVERDLLIQRLRQEVVNQIRLHHENVVPVSDAGEEQGVPYIVLRYVEGGTLHDWLDTHPDMSVPQREELLRQIAAGLDHAHDVGVLHRDIKPSNVLIDARAGGSARALVSDFGLALSIDGSAGERLTAPGWRLGTAEYTAPELWKAGGATKASDVYAFGCLAYEVLTGRPPFQGTTDQVMYGHVTVQPDPPSTYRPECRGAIDAMIAALLRKEPSQRPASASAALGMLASPRSWTALSDQRATLGADRPYAVLLRQTGTHVLAYVAVFGAAFLGRSQHRRA